MRLLLDEPPLVIQPTLAVAVGLHEALVLQQIHYWLNRSQHEHEGRRWIFNSYAEWVEQFPFWTERQVRSAIHNLEQSGILVTGNFNRTKADRTKWYSIDYEALSLKADVNPSDIFVSPSDGEVDSGVTNDRPLPETTTKKNARTRYSTGEMLNLFEPHEMEFLSTTYPALDIAVEAAKWADWHADSDGVVRPKVSFRNWLTKAEQIRLKDDGRIRRRYGNGRAPGPEQRAARTEELRVYGPTGRPKE